MWQASRNKRLAQQLISDLGHPESSFKEWAVVTTFYTAVHLVEADLTTDAAIGHSETSRPTKFRASIHEWRDNLVMQKHRAIWVNFRKLRNESNVARYLSTSGGPIGQPVEDYFSESDVVAFMTNDLTRIELELGISA